MEFVEKFTMEKSCLIKAAGNLKDEVPLVSFTNGNLAYDTTSVKVDYYSNMNIGERQKGQKILVGHSGDMQYIGQNFGFDDSMNISRYNAFCRYHVGVLNKRTGKMNVYPSEIFQLKPFLEDNSSKNNADFQNTPRGEKRDLLTSAFGSKRKKRAMDSRIRYAVDADTLKGTISEAILAVKTTEIEIDGKASKDSSDALPPQNRSASSVEDIFDLNALISEREYEVLESHAINYVDLTPSQIAEMRETEKHSDYVLNYLIKKRGVNIHDAKILAYIDHLVALLKLKHTDFRKKDPMPEIEEDIKVCILNKFTVVNAMNHRTMPVKCKDKVMAYILSLVLILEKFTVCLNDLLKDFKALKKLTTLANILGCYVTTAKETTYKIAVLRLPLFEIKEPRIRKRIK